MADSAPLIAIIVALIAPLGAYLLAARRFSGKIGTSDAAELWEESRSIRDWSKERIAGLTQKSETLELRVAALERSNTLLDTQNKLLTMQVENANGVIADLRAKVAALEALCDRLKIQLEESQRQVRELGGKPKATGGEQ